MKMKRSETPAHNPDDLLTDFTDHVLDGKTGSPRFSTTDEMQRLEETVVRLNRALPYEILDEETLKRMQVNFKSRVGAGPASRPAWQSQQSRQKFILSFALTGILVVIFIAIPFLLSPGGSVQATAGFQTQGILILSAIGCMIALMVWLGRRK